MPYRKMWADYGREVDVLYINFNYPPEAIDLMGKGMSVGITVISASGFAKRNGRG